MKIIWLLLAAAVLAPAVLASDSPQEVLAENSYEESLVLNGKVREVLRRIRQLIAQAREQGSEALLRLLDSDRLEALVSQLPERIQGEVRKRLQRLRDRLSPEESLILNGKVREVLRRIRQLIAQAREQGSEALLRLLDSDRLENLVSQLPERIQGEVRKRLQRLRDRLSPEESFGSDWREKVIARIERAIERVEQRLESLPEDSPARRYLERKLEYLQKALDRLTQESAVAGDWREKAIEYLTKAIARLEEAIEKLPEGSKLRAVLSKALQYLRLKLTDLQDGEMSFSSGDRVEILRKVLARLEAAIESLPEGRLRSMLERKASYIRLLIDRLS